MTSNWEGLWALVRQMGASRAEDFDITLPPPISIEYNEGLAKGVPIQLPSLDPPGTSGGLLSYKGSQVLVYIPDQGGSLANVLRNPENGKRFHVSHCSTLTSMEAQNRNHRYVATNDTSGIFDLTDWTGTEKARGALKVCRNCLKHINYQDYSGRLNERTTIFRNFNLTQFFSTYSSLFKHPYARTQSRLKQRYPEIAEPAAEWTVVSTPRTCSKCKVTLSGNVELTKRTTNGEADTPTFLCADCNRREHWLTAEPVLVDEMHRITGERRKQGLLSEIGSWEEAYDLADPAFHGLMKVYQRQGREVPEVGYPLTDSDGVVLDVELALAWETARFAVVASTEEQSECEPFDWVVQTLSEALIDSREDG